MKKIVIIDTSYPINSRTDRFLTSLNKQFHVEVVSWNRNGSEQKVEKNYHILNVNSEYGNKIKKLFKIPKFIYFLNKQLKETNPDIVFASHWDSLFCIKLIQMLTKKRYKVIYDCLDLPVSNSSFITKMLRFIEKQCLKSADLTIFASRYFPESYNYNFKYVIFENYPSFTITNNLEVPDWYKKLKEKKTIISWIGVVRYEEVLINILKSIKKIDCLFYVFGDGPSLEKLKKIVFKYELENKVKFFGRYNQNELSYIYEISDLVWAAYPTNNHNAIYAISNKYYECSLFEKVIVVSRKTKMAQHLKNFQESCILLDEYDEYDIVGKINYHLSRSSSRTYRKYEKDIFWEEKENLLIEKIKIL